MVWINTIFVLTLVALAFIPKKRKIFTIWLVIFITNVGVRCYLISENEEKSNKIAALEQKLIEEKQTIRSFDSSIELTLEGTWKDGRTPDKRKLLSPTQGEYYLVLETLSEDDTNAIRFYSTERFSYILEESRRVIFRSRQAVKPGSFPLGENIQALEPYKRITVWIPRIRQKNLLDEDLVLITATIDFYINGELFHTRKHNVPSKIGLFDDDFAGFSLVGPNITDKTEQID